MRVAAVLDRRRPLVTTWRAAASVDPAVIAAMTEQFLAALRTLWRWAAEVWRRIAGSPRRCR